MLFGGRKSSKKKNVAKHCKFDRGSVWSVFQNIFFTKFMFSLLHVDDKQLEGEGGELKSGGEADQKQLL